MPRGFMDLHQHALMGRFTEPGSSAIRAAYEYGLQKAAFEKLWELYPGYDWAVKIHTSRMRGGGDGSVMTIRIGTIMHQALGFNFPVDKLATDPSLSIVKRAGGELLERWKLRRAKANAAEFREAKLRKRIHSYKDRAPV